MSGTLPLENVVCSHYEGKGLIPIVLWNYTRLLIVVISDADMHLCALLVVFGLCVGQALGSYRVLGWKVKRYTENSSRLLATVYKFGDSSDGGTWITWGKQCV